MAKRSVLDEIQIAALSAAIELVKNPEYSREWLKKEFAEREIKSVRMTDDILDAVEFALTNNLNYVAAQMKQRLEEGIKHADSVDPDETPAMKRVKQILANSEDPVAIAFLAGEDVTSKLEGGDIPVVDFIGNLHDDSKTSETFGTLPAGSKIARAVQAAKVSNEQDFVDSFAGVRYDPTQDEYFDRFEEGYYGKSLEVIKAEELAKGNEVSHSEAIAILRNRLTVGLPEGALDSPKNQVEDKFASFHAYFAKCVEKIIADELAKGNKLSEAEAVILLRNSLYV
jgi:hypothetical protein